MLGTSSGHQAARPSACAILLAGLRPLAAIPTALGLELGPTGRLGLRLGLGVALGLALMPASAAGDPEQAGRRLLAAYPTHLRALDGNWLIWADGTRMAIDDGRGAKAPEVRLAEPDLEDMLVLPYPAGGAAVAPPPGDDPGRARNAAFFDKMYGDCRKGEVTKSLVDVVWLPRKSGQRLKVTVVNDVARRLAAVSEALDRLPARFDRFLIPSAGTYHCRAIAGTDRQSAHGHGIAIDIAVQHSDYWRWSRTAPGAAPAYRNAIPPEIVAIFEAHGFIWGGRWFHYDTMHFEYRPELLQPLAPLPSPP